MQMERASAMSLQVQALLRVASFGSSLQPLQLWVDWGVVQRSGKRREAAGRGEEFAGDRSHGRSSTAKERADLQRRLRQSSAVEVEVLDLGRPKRAPCVCVGLVRDAGLPEGTADAQRAICSASAAAVAAVAAGGGKGGAVVPAVVVYLSPSLAASLGLTTRDGGDRGGSGSPGQQPWECGTPGGAGGGQVTPLLSVALTPCSRGPSPSGDALICEASSLTLRGPFPPAALRRSLSDLSSMASASATAPPPAPTPAPAQQPLLPSNLLPPLLGAALCGVVLSEGAVLLRSLHCWDFRVAAVTTHAGGGGGRAFEVTANTLIRVEPFEGQERGRDGGGGGTRASAKSGGEGGEASANSDSDRSNDENLVEPQPRSLEALCLVLREEVGGCKVAVERLVGVLHHAVQGQGQGQGQGCCVTNCCSVGGVRRAHGVLLHGPGGVGKTLLARAVAKHSGLPVRFVACPALFRKNRGEAEALLAGVLREATTVRMTNGPFYGPSVVVLDQVEAIGGRRGASTGATELTVLATLLEGLDRLSACRAPGGCSGCATNGCTANACASCPCVIVIATTPSAALLDPSLLQRGRLEVLCEMTPPSDTEEALQVLAIHTRAMRGEGERGERGERGDRGGRAVSAAVSAAGLARGHGEEGGVQGGRRLCMEGGEGGGDGGRRLDMEGLRSVALRCHGYAGADLQLLCTEAAQAALRRAGHGMGQGGGCDVTLGDFEVALGRVRPSVLSSLTMAGGGQGASPQGAVSLSSLVGAEEAVRSLRSALLLPLQMPGLLHALGLGLAKGLLLHGPAGCGKTLAARAIASEARPHANFLAVECSQLVDKVVGRSEAAVSRLFATARQASPCLLFLDSVESLAGVRGHSSSSEQTFDRILSTLLTEMDGVMGGGQVVVLAATTRREDLDPAILRPGRLDKHVHMGLPDALARRKMFASHLARLPLRFSDKEDSPHSPRDPPSVAPPLTPGRSAHTSSSHMGSVGACAEWLSLQTEGLSGAEVKGLCEEAAMEALREDLKAETLGARHLHNALAKAMGHSAKARGGRLRE